MKLRVILAILIAPMLLSFYFPPIIGQEFIKTKIYLNIKHYDDVNWC